MSTEGAFKYYIMPGLGEKGVGARSNRFVKCRKDQFSALHKNPNIYYMRFMNQKHTKKCMKSKPKCDETQHKFTMRGQAKCENGVGLYRDEAHESSEKNFYQLWTTQA